MSITDVQAGAVISMRFERPFLKVWCSLHYSPLPAPLVPDCPKGRAARVEHMLAKQGTKNCVFSY